MAIQNKTLASAEHDYFATRSGLPANAPLTEHKAKVFSDAGFGGVGKPLSQMDREWLQSIANSSKINEGDLWREAVARSGLTPTVSTSENKFLFYTSEQVFKVKIGSYTGNGTTQSVSGLGFTPQVVIVKGGTGIWQLCTLTMGSDATKPMTGSSALYSGGVTALGSDGFSLGSNAAVNTNSTTYHYIALAGSGSSYLKVTSYTGTGTNPTAITGIGFASDLILFAPANGNTPGFRTSDMPTDSYYRPEAFANLANRVESIDSDGFTLNSTNEVNQSGVTYHVVCIKNAANLFKAFTYTGNGVDDRTLTGVGFQPDASFTRNGTNAVVMAARFKDQVGDLSFLVDATAAAADRIQAFTSDGFQVGTATAVNENLSTYYSFNFKEGTITP